MLDILHKPGELIARCDQGVLDPNFRFDQHFSGFQRLGHAPFRWRRRRVLNELDH